MNLQEKINKSVKLLQVFAKGKVVELSYSGGKDSDVILELAKMAGIEYRAIYKNTTIDPPHTLAHCKANGVEIITPKMRFFEIVAKRGYPTRRARFCCDILKEYKVLDNSVQGIRRCESAKRAQLYKEPIICRVFGRKENHVNICLPILEWTDDDVTRFVALRGIKCHPLYYDEQGNFHVERRLGCMGCPLAGDRGLKDFKKMPKLARAWIMAGKRYIEDHPHNQATIKFQNAYNLFYHNVFCESYADYQHKISEDLWGERIDCKAELEKYFGIDL